MFFMLHKSNRDKLVNIWIYLLSLSIISDAFQFTFSPFNCLSKTCPVGGGSVPVQLVAQLSLNTRRRKVTWRLVHLLEYRGFMRTGRDAAVKVICKLFFSYLSMLFIFSLEVIEDIFVFQRIF